MRDITIKKRLLTALLLSLTGCSEANQKYSGIFETIYIAQPTADIIKGFYEESLGAGHKCVFSFEGKTQGNHADITVNGEGFTGHIEFQDKELILTIENARDIPGCAMVLMPEIATGLSYTSSQKASWIDLKKASQQGAKLYLSATTQAEKITSISPRTVMGILEQSNGWVRVSFYDENGFIEGWVKRTELTDD